MRFINEKWRGFQPLLCCIILKLIFANLKDIDAKPQHIVSSFLKRNLNYNNKTNIIDSITLVTSTIIWKSQKLQNLSDKIPPTTKSGNNTTTKSIYSSQETLKSPEITQDNFWKSYEEDFFSDISERIPLNLSQFSLVRHRRSLSEELTYIPRFMMEFFSTTDKSRKLPEGATIVRSYPTTLLKHLEDGGVDENKISTTMAGELNKNESILREEDIPRSISDTSIISNQSAKANVFDNVSDTTSLNLLNQSDKAEKNHLQKINNTGLTFNISNISEVNLIAKSEDLKSGVKRKEKISFINNKIKKQIYTINFNLTFFKKEELHSSVFRIYTRARRKTQSLVGVERRIRIFINKIEDNSFQDLKEDEGGAKTLVTQQDVYILSNKWTEFDISFAVDLFRKNPQLPQKLTLEVSSEFFTVGDGGEFEFVSDTEHSSLRPFILIYSLSSDTKKNDMEDSTHRNRRSLSSAEWEEEETNSIWEGGAEIFSDFPPQMYEERKLGRKARKKRAKNSCRIKPLKVEFKKIGWNWIIHPTSYEAYQCSGKCFYPLASHLSPTKHAIVQNLIHSLHPESASRACCVPTKLGPISMLYEIEGVTTFKKDYSEMRVLQCGCR